MMTKISGTTTRTLVGATIMAFVSAAAIALPAPEDAPERAKDSRDKMICKRFVATGSLVRGYRTCKTKWEWERERENLRTLSVSDSCRDRANGGSLCTN
jgi:hypothetical protein